MKLNWPFVDFELLKLCCYCVAVVVGCKRGRLEPRDALIYRGYVDEFSVGLWREFNI